VGFEGAKYLGTDFASAIVLVHQRQEIPAGIRRPVKQIAHTAKKGLLIAGAAQQRIEPILRVAGTPALTGLLDK
jgi:hypothetical protein